MSTVQRHGSKARSQVTLEQVAQLLHLPITAAADALGVCVALLKRKCRTLGLDRWPHRQVKALSTKLSLRSAPGRPLPQQLQRELDSLREFRESRLRSVARTSIDDLLYGPAGGGASTGAAMAGIAQPVPAAPPAAPALSAPPPLLPPPSGPAVVGPGSSVTQGSSALATRPAVPMPTVPISAGLFGKAGAGGGAGAGAGAGGGSSNTLGFGGGAGAHTAFPLGAFAGPAGLGGVPLSARSSLAGLASVAAAQAPPADLYLAERVSLQHQQPYLTEPPSQPPPAHGHGMETASSLLFAPVALLPPLFVRVAQAPPPSTVSAPAPPRDPLPVHVPPIGARYQERSVAAAVTSAAMADASSATTAPPIPGAADAGAGAGVTPDVSTNPSAAAAVGAAPRAAAVAGGGGGGGAADRVGAAKAVLPHLHMMLQPRSSSQASPSLVRRDDGSDGMYHLLQRFLQFSEVVATRAPPLLFGGRLLG